MASTASALEQSAKLRTLFNTYDTSGNGAIDPTEFRVVGHTGLEPCARL